MRQSCAAHSPEPARKGIRPLIQLRSILFSKKFGQAQPWRSVGTATQQGSNMPRTLPGRMSSMSQEGFSTRQRRDRLKLEGKQTERNTVRASTPDRERRMSSAHRSRPPRYPPSHTRRGRRTCLPHSLCSTRWVARCPCSRGRLNPISYMTPTPTKAEL